MAITKREVLGLIQGRTVVLNEDPGLPDGSSVMVWLTPLSFSNEDGRERLRNAAGAWADDAEELGRYLEWNRAQRKISRPQIQE